MLFKPESKEDTTEGARKPGGLRKNVYLSVSDRKFRTVDRCC